MLERLNKFDVNDVPSGPPPPPPVEQPMLPLADANELPLIELPPLRESSSAQKNTEVAKSLNRLENRIDKLLNRLEIQIEPPQPSPVQTIGDEPLSSLPVIELDTIDNEPVNSYALPEEISNQDHALPPLPKNRFNFYLGLSIPNDSTYSDAGNHDIEFENGFEIGLEYNRFFEDESYIGAFIEGKFFETDSLAGSATNGDNRLINFGFTLGQDWSLSEHFAVKTQASIGASSAHYEITSENYSSTELAFHYSFLLGLEVKWNEYWQTSLYYELDGRSSADRMDYQSFHQIGVVVGAGF